MAVIEIWKDRKMLNLLVRKVKVMPHYFAKTFFSELKFHDKNEIHFNEDETEEGISAFAHPLSEGKILLDEGSQVKAFTPAYIKESAVIDMQKALEVLPDEEYDGSRSPDQRLRYHTAKYIVRLRNRYENRLEAMAIEALRDGRATIKGKGFGSGIVLDFGRDPSLKEIALSDTDRWSNPDFSILTQLKGMKAKIKEKSRVGAIANDVYLNQTTANYLEQNNEIKALFETRRGVDIDMKITPHQDYEDIEYWGRIGNFRFWIHSGSYLENGVRKKILNDGEVILAAKSVRGIRHFGKIISKTANFKPLSIFIRPYSDTKTETDYLEMHSSPLLIPHDVNAAGYMEVL